MLKRFDFCLLPLEKWHGKLGTKFQWRPQVEEYRCKSSESKKRGTISQHIRLALGESFGISKKVTLSAIIMEVENYLINERTLKKNWREPSSNFHGYGRFRVVWNGKLAGVPLPWIQFLGEHLLVERVPRPQTRGMWLPMYFWFDITV